MAVVDMSFSIIFLAGFGNFIKCGYVSHNIHTDGSRDPAGRKSEMPGIDV